MALRPHLSMGSPLSIRESLASILRSHVNYITDAQNERLRFGVDLGGSKPGA